MEPKIHENKYARAADYDGMVTVVQSTTYTIPVTWQDANIKWQGVGEVSPELTNKFINVLAHAVALADRWNEERSGKAAIISDGGTNGTKNQ